MNITVGDFLDESLDFLRQALRDYVDEKWK
jgi:hypothetical protein